MGGFGWTAPGQQSPCPAPSVLPVPSTWRVNSCTRTLCQGRYKRIKKGTLTFTKCICQKVSKAQHVPSPAQLQASSAGSSARLKCPLTPHVCSQACRHPSAGIAAHGQGISFPLLSLPLTLLHQLKKFNLHPCQGAGRHPDHVSQEKAGWLQGSKAAFGI